MRVAIGSTEIATGSCIGRDGLVGSGRQVATGSYKEGDRFVIPEGQVATGLLSRSNRDSDACRDMLENAAYRAIAFSDWAQSAHRFSAYERHRGMRRVLNATALVVAFMLPLFGGLRLHSCRVSCVVQSADIGLGKATASYVAVRAVASSARPGELDAGSLRRFGLLGSCLARSRREDVAWSGEDVVPWMVFTFFTKNLKNGVDGLRAPSPHEFSSSLASLPGPETLGNELGPAMEVGYWRHEPVVRSHVAASFLSDSCFATGSETHWLWFNPCGVPVVGTCVKVLPVVVCLVLALVRLWFPWWYLVVVGGVVELCSVEVL
ncbi:hypothetical protein Taro_019566 [Colocasia esculenta]|uniref:Uncharacterized protein n=1 Tax=Colocasia esculenta TaxID=4460 RepID=A0A843UZK2_COLES|nr:hypothetical protein [Colocasia esculenta]